MHFEAILNPSTNDCGCCFPMWSAWRPRRFQNVLNASALSWTFLLVLYFTEISCLACEPVTQKTADKFMSVRRANKCCKIFLQAYFKGKQTNALVYIWLLNPCLAVSICARIMCATFHPHLYRGGMQKG
jgi:hypothetical protein